jgi:hypothetical protein
VIAATDTRVRQPRLTFELGWRSIVGYGCAAAALEALAVSAGATAATIGYALLLLIMVNHVAVGVLRGDVQQSRRMASFAVVAVPLVLRLTTLTLENGPVVLARHYAFLGGAAAVAAVCAVWAFPELRTGLGVTGGVPQQVVVALAGLALGLVFSYAFARTWLVPEHGRWQHALPVVVLLVGAAVVEEVLFRGSLQSALRPAFGQWVPLASTAALVLVYLNVHPASVAVAFIEVGLLSAITVELTGSLRGVLAGRVLLLISLVYIWPRLLGLH